MMRRHLHIPRLPINIRLPRLNHSFPATTLSDRLFSTRSTHYNQHYSMADMHPSKEKSDTANENPQAKENVTQEARNVRTLAETAEATLLEDLRSSLEIQSRKAIFACGGIVNFTPNSEETSPQPTQSADDIPPIDLRFGENGKGMVLTLPTETDNSRQFEALLSACKPAAFGRGREEILDEGYRKASKLDREAFATNLCPYEAGIIDLVAQLLLSSSSNHEHKRSIKVFLEKLLCRHT